MEREEKMQKQSKVAIDCVAIVTDEAVRVERGETERRHRLSLLLQPLPRRSVILIVCLPAAMQ